MNKNTAKTINHQSENCQQRTIDNTLNNTEFITHLRLDSRTAK